MGNATSLFSLMRNLGGSVGIALVATTIARPSTTGISLCTTPGSTSALAMSARGYAVTAGLRPVDATDLMIDPSATVRERNVSTKGQLGSFAHTTPGIQAWSPPLR